MQSVKQLSTGAADRLHGIKVPKAEGLTAGDLVRSLIKQLREDHIAAFAGNLAFRSIFAVFATMTLGFMLLGLFGATQTIETLLSRLGPTVPDEVIQALREQIVTSAQQATNRPFFTLGTITTVVGALYGLLTTARGVIDGMNVMYEVKERRPFFRRLTVSLLMAVFVITLLIGALLIVVVGPALGRMIGNVLGIGDTLRYVWVVLQWPALFALVVLAFDITYWVAPACPVSFKFITHGSITALALWLVASLGLAAYLQNFSSFGATYGALTGVVALLFYAFLSAIALFIGAETNDVVRRHLREHSGLPTR